MRSVFERRCRSSRVCSDRWFPRGWDEGAGRTFVGVRAVNNERVREWTHSQQERPREAGTNVEKLGRVLHVPRGQHLVRPHVHELEARIDALPKNKPKSVFIALRIVIVVGWVGYIREEAEWSVLYRDEESEENGTQTHPSQKRRLRDTRRSSEISLVSIRKDNEAAIMPETVYKQRRT